MRRTATSSPKVGRRAPGTPARRLLHNAALSCALAAADRLQTPNHLCRAGQLVEVRFDELDARPLDTLRSIYETLSLGDFDAVRPAFERYCGGLELRGFKKNAHRWEG